MDTIERRWTEYLLESTEKDDLLGGFSCDVNDENLPIYEPHDQNTDTEKSMSSASSISLISNESDFEYSYHGSDDYLPIYLWGANIMPTCRDHLIKICSDCLTL